VKRLQGQDIFCIEGQASEVRAITGLAPVPSPCSRAPLACWPSSPLPPPALLSLLSLLSLRPWEPL